MLSLEKEGQLDEILGCKANLDKENIVYKS